MALCYNTDGGCFFQNQNSTSTSYCMCTNVCKSRTGIPGEFSVGSTLHLRGKKEAPSSIYYRIFIFNFILFFGGWWALKRWKSSSPTLPPSGLVNFPGEPISPSIWLFRGNQPQGSSRPFPLTFPYPIEIQTPLKYSFPLPQHSQHNSRFLRSV